MTDDRSSPVRPDRPQGPPGRCRCGGRGRARPRRRRRRRRGRAGHRHPAAHRHHARDHDHRLGGRHHGLDRRDPRRPTPTDPTVDDSTTDHRSTTRPPTVEDEDEGTEAEHPENHGKDVSEAAHDHSQDDAAGNHGRHVRDVARGGGSTATTEAPVRRRDLLRRPRPRRALTDRSAEIDPGLGWAGGRMPAEAGDRLSRPTNAGGPRPRAARRSPPRRRRVRCSTRPRAAASGGRRRPWPRAPVTARAPRTRRRCRSGRRCRRWSSPSSTAWGSTPSMPRQTRWGRRPAGPGRRSRWTPSTAASRSTTRSVRRRLRRLLGGQRAGRPGPRGARHRARRGRARSRARPGGPAPGRRRRAAARRRRPRRTSSTPMPAGPPNLWPLTDSRSAPRAPRSIGHVADGLGGVDVHQHAALAAGGDHLGHGLQGADLVVAPLEVHQRGVGADGVQQLVGVDPAARRRRRRP